MKYNDLVITDYATMEELINEASNEFTIYGTLDQYANKFKCIHLLESGFKCGLVYSYSGLKPEVIKINGSKILIGFDKALLLIDQLKKILLEERKLSSLFYEFINVGRNNLIVVICELDLVVLDFDGEILWSIGFKDIIEDFYVENSEFLNITCSDGQDYKFDINNGQYANN